MNYKPVMQKYKPWLSTTILPFLEDSEKINKLNTKLKNSFSGRKKKKGRRDAVTKYSNIPIMLQKGTIFQKIQPQGHIFIDCEGRVTVDLTEVHR